MRPGRLVDKGFLGKAACSFRRNILESIGVAKMLEEFQGTMAALEEEKEKLQQGQREAVSFMEREKKRADDALTALKAKASLSERYRKVLEDTKIMASNLKLEVEDLTKKLEEAKLTNNELKSTIDRLEDEKKAVDTQFQTAVKMLTSAGSEFMGAARSIFYLLFPGADSNLVELVQPEHFVLDGKVQRSVGEDQYAVIYEPAEAFDDDDGGDGGDDGGDDCGEQQDQPQGVEDLE